MIYTILAYDKPNSSDLRQKVRPDHLAYAQTHGASIRLGGPLLDQTGQQMEGSLLIVEFETPDQVETFCKNDPYALAGLFERVEIKPMRLVLGTLKPA